MITEQAVTPVRTYKLWTAKDERDLRQMAADGIPAKAIAQAMDRTYSSINNRAKELGIRMAYQCGEDHQCAKYPDHVIRAIRTLRAAGFTSVSIAQLFKKSWRISASHVANVCRGEWRKEDQTA